MSANSFDSFLIKEQRKIINDIKEIIPNVEGIESIFERVVQIGNKEVGFETNSASNLRIIMRLGPNEAANKAVLFELSERYDTLTRTKVYYRYEFYWTVNIPFSNETSKYSPDYIDAVLLDLRRSIRFDHHPNQKEKSFHPEFHWHPNGCSELRLPTDNIEPIHILVFARILFDSSFIGEVLDSPRLTNVLNEIEKRICKLPINK